MVSALALLLLALQLPTSQLALQHVEHLAMTEQMSYGFVMPGSETLGVRSVVNIIQNELRCICTWQNFFCMLHHVLLGLCRDILPMLQMAHDSPSQVGGRAAVCC